MELCSLEARMSVPFPVYELTTYAVLFATLYGAASGFKFELPSLNSRSFQGVLTLQAFVYYENFPKDHIVLKLLVAAVWVLDLAHLILVSQSCYHYLIGSWGDSAALLVSTTELDLHLVFVGFACFICQCFFISRIWSFSHKNWILSVALGIPCLVVLVLETNISAEITRIASVAAFNQFTGEVLSVFALAAAVDVAIALILVWYLQQGKTSFGRSSFVVGRIVQYTVATGLATSILAVADLIVYLVTPHTFIFIAMHFSMGRMYTNALLATLNSRSKLREVLQGGARGRNPVGLHNWTTNNSLSPSFFAGLQTTTDNMFSGTHASLNEHPSEVTTAQWHKEDVESRRSDHTANFPITWIQYKLSILLQVGGKYAQENRRSAASNPNTSVLTGGMYGVTGSRQDACSQHVGPHGRLSLLLSASTSHSRKPQSSTPPLLLNMEINSLMVNLHGGTGGAGGDGGQSGGSGGVGQGGHLEVSHNQNVSMNIYTENSDAERDKILEWISPINFFIRQQEISRSRQENTGGWLIDHPTFKTWEVESGKLLWCPGIPGVGKTVLVSKVMEHFMMQANPTIGIACLYLNYQEAKLQTLPNLIGALWRQLSLNKSIDSGKALYNSHKEKQTMATSQEIQKLLKARVQEFSRVYIIIDALDEYSQSQEKLLESLGQLGNANILVTCRPHVQRPAREHVLSLEIVATEEDIKTYISAQIQESPNLKALEEQGFVTEMEIVSKVNNNAQGMFLIAHLQMKLLSTAITKQDLTDLLNQTSETLQASYHQVLERIKQSSTAKRAITALFWVSNAKRPLTVLELQTILAITEYGTQLVPPPEIRLSVTAILNACHGLLVTEELTKIVRLVHYTTQPFLESVEATEFPDSSIQITKTLIKYIRLAQTRSWQKPERLYGDSGKHYFIELKWRAPLLNYCQYFMMHAAGTPAEVVLRDTIIGMLDGWKHITWSITPWQFDVDGALPQIIAVGGNLLHITEYLLKNKPRTLWGTKKYEFLGELIIASGAGYLPMVQMLLKYKGTKKNDNLHISLFAAANYGHTEIVRLLLKHGAFANFLHVMELRPPCTPLLAAVRNQHTEVVELLLAAGADYDDSKRNGGWESMLHKAAYHENARIVQLLLDAGADCNATCFKDRTPLDIAVHYANTDVIQVLTAAGGTVSCDGYESEDSER
uniref:NACHT domain-containing protein n=1 Tax=Mycena chlorophos TaxID=658473 RepID=A0ABQ0LKW6_MYCCL|nr:predicted protein [Mycena chlorophos]